MKLPRIGLVTFVMLTACGDSSNRPSANDATPPGESLTASSRIFGMPYLMRELDNGLRVIIVETDYPDIVDLQITVQAGSRNETEKGKSGFAHFFEHMMFRGTENYPSDAYSAILKKAGAESNAFTTDDYTNFYMTFTKPDLEKMLELEADRFQNLDYSESGFRTEALAVKGEYLKNFSNPIMKAFERTRALAFAEHPYSHTTMGFIEDIETMPDQIEYAQEFFDRWYRPENTAIVIVGDVDPENTFELVNEYWSGWEKGDYVADIPAEPAPAGPAYEHIQWEGDTQPWIFIGFRSAAFLPSNKDLPSMRVISSIYFSESSDLYQKLVIEDQTVDQLMTDFPLNKDPNLNLIYLRLTDEKYAAEVTASVMETLAESRTVLIGAIKLEQTKARLRYSFTTRLDGSASIGSMLSEYVQFARTPETINEYYETFDQLTAEDVRAGANQYFHDASKVIVTLSNSESILDAEESVSIEELVADSPMDTPVANALSRPIDKKPEVFPSDGEPVPIAIVAKPSTTSPLVDVSILIHAGAGMDPEGKKGLASLTAAMISDSGSGTWSIEEINDAMYPIASGFNAQVDKEMTRLSGQVHQDNLATWYQYARSQLLNPGWHHRDFERLKTQLKNSIRTGLVGNNDEELGKELLYSEIYGPVHPYASPNLGHSGDVDSMTLDDVREFYQSYYTVRNLTVGVSGGYPQSFIEKMSKDLQTLPAGRRSSVDLPAARVLENSRATIVEKETPAVAVSFGFPIELKRGDPDWVALWLARSYLGEHRSENSHLYQRIRESRGMNYGDYAYIEYFPNGMFQMQPDTNLGRQQQIFQVWIRPLRNNNDAHFATRTATFELNKLIDDGLSEAEFEATRSFLSKFVSLITDGQSRQLGYALDSEYYETEAFVEYVRDGLARLTLADVNRVIRENLKSENLQYVFVTSDAVGLKNRLVDDTPSPMTYDAAQPQALLQEDKLIEQIPLGLSSERVMVISAENVFD